MSTDWKGPPDAPVRWARPKNDVKEPGGQRTPDVEQIDIDRLEIDESFAVDCDPYNSTGQHLVDTLKKRYED